MPLRFSLLQVICLGGRKRKKKYVKICQNRTLNGACCKLIEQNPNVFLRHNTSSSKLSVVCLTAVILAKKNNKMAWPCFFAHCVFAYAAHVVMMQIWWIISGFLVFLRRRCCFNAVLTRQSAADFKVCSVCCRRIECLLSCCFVAEGGSGPFKAPARSLVALVHLVIQMSLS